jgi:hypothetical protein
MFERYTEKARRTIFFARYEASQFGSPYIESEHVLLGLLRESKALSARLLANPPATADTIRKLIEKHTTFGEKIPTSVDLPINEECQRILLHASEEAERLGHKYVGTEHLLLGVLLEKQCYAAHLLNECGVSLEVARAYIGGGTLEEVATPPKSPGIPVGSSWQQLLYNPASKTIVAEMRSVADRPLPPLGRLFMRPRHADAYEQIGNPADNVSYQTPVTCEKQPIVVFNSIKWDDVKGGGNPDGVYVFNLRTKDLSVCVGKDELTIPDPHLRLWIQALISLSDDGQTLYANIGIEKAAPNGAVVHYYLARLGLTDKKLELLCHLKDIRF